MVFMVLICEREIPEEVSAWITVQVASAVSLREINKDYMSLSVNTVSR